ncbi:hypothetical protein JB92DRAFT_2825165 [Gautieria morchelliformis]|nr:hypothetical protein JB92DRAFT_2825165 [Gautieria morchelliformis]
MDSKLKQTMVGATHSSHGFERLNCSGIRWLLVSLNARAASNITVVLSAMHINKLKVVNSSMNYMGGLTGSDGRTVHTALVGNFDVAGLGWSMDYFEPLNKDGSLLSMSAHYAYLFLVTFMASHLFNFPTGSPPIYASH